MIFSRLIHSFVWSYTHWTSVESNKYKKGTSFPESTSVKISFSVMLLLTVEEVLQTKKKFKILLMLLFLTAPSQISQQKHLSIHHVICEYREQQWPDPWNGSLQQKTGKKTEFS